MSVEPYVPDMQRMPLYPIFLRLCQLNPVIILVIQGIIQSLTAWYIYKILSQYTRLARYLAFLYWIMPVSMLFSMLVLTECMFVFFMIIGLYFVQQKKWIQANILLVLSVFIRPNSLVIIVFLLGVGVVYLWHKKAQKQEMIPFVIGILISFMLISGWMYRNYTLCGHWKISLLSDNTLIHGRLGGLLCYQKNLPYTDDNLVCESEKYLIQQNIYPIKTYYSPIHRQETEIYTTLCHKEAYKYIFNHLCDYALFQVECGMSLFKGMGYKSWVSIFGHKSVSLFLAIIQFFYTIMCMFIFLNSIVHIKTLDSMQKIVLMSIIMMFIVSLLPYADTRYRFPIDSLMFLLCRCGRIGKSLAVNY